jgi:hypothetical protein
MNVAQLLKQEKGRYTLYEPHYKELRTIPFSHMSCRKLEDMKVLSFFYREDESLSFDINFKFKGIRNDKTLVIIWDK